MYNMYPLTPYMYIPKAILKHALGMPTLAESHSYSSATRHGGRSHFSAPERCSSYMNACRYISVHVNMSIVIMSKPGIGGGICPAQVRLTHTGGYLVG